MGVKESIGTWGWEGEEEWEDSDKDRVGDQGESSCVCYREQTVRGRES